MRARSRCGRLADALRVLLPGSEIDQIRETDWHSATFAGVRCEIDMRLSGENAANRAREFRDRLPDHEFNLPRNIVADIAVLQITELGPQITLSLEALLLGD
jgi:hypothetical protein